MSPPVTLQRQGQVALITIDNPPVNAIAHPVRAGLLQAIVEADEDPAIQAIVLHGAGRNFIAGADVREMDQPAREPLLNDVLLRLEACRKPVVAALHGAFLVVGLETALASCSRNAGGRRSLRRFDTCSWQSGALPGAIRSAASPSRVPR